MRTPILAMIAATLLALAAVITTTIHTGAEPWAWTCWSILAAATIWTAATDHHRNR